MSFVYILYSEKDKGWYFGCTTLALKERLKYHNQGKVKSTKSRRPLVLAYFEESATNSLARKREWYLKHPIGYVEKRRIVDALDVIEKLSWPLRGPLGIRALH